jgi:hypothetical protein
MVGIENPGTFRQVEGNMSLCSSYIAASSLGAHRRQAFMSPTLQSPHTPPLMFLMGLSFRPSQELICCGDCRGFDIGSRMCKEAEILTVVLYRDRPGFKSGGSRKERAPRIAIKQRASFLFTPIFLGPSNTICFLIIRK